MRCEVQHFWIRLRVLSLFTGASYCQCYQQVEKKTPSTWAFINVIKSEEVHFSQQLIHAQSGKIKKIFEKTCIMQYKLDQLRTCFNNGTTDLIEYSWE